MLKVYRLAEESGRIKLFSKKRRLSEQRSTDNQHASHKQSIGCIQLVVTNPMLSTVPVWAVIWFVGALLTRRIVLHGQERWKTKKTEAPYTHTHCFSRFARTLDSSILWTWLDFGCCRMSDAGAIRMHPEVIFRFFWCSVTSVAAVFLVWSSQAGRTCSKAVSEMLLREACISNTSPYLSCL